MSAAPTPIAGLRWHIKIANKLSEHLSLDCFLTTGLGWHTTPGWGTDPYVDPAKGSWDPVARIGSVAGTSKALLFDSFTQRMNHTGHAWQIDNVGLELKGGRAYITARIHSAKSLLVAARRQRIAVIAHPDLKFGIGHSFSPRGKDLGIQPNSFVIGMSGRAAITKAFVAATRRWRCRGKFANYSRPHVRPGEALGNVTVGLGATRATGLAGDLVLARASFEDDDTGEPIALTAIAPATKRTVQGEPSLRFEMRGVQIPLACKLGASCSPVGGTVPLPGGFTLSSGGRSATIDGLSVTWSLDSGGFLLNTLSGTVDGQPMTIATGTGPSATDEFLAYVSGALGVKARDRLGGVDPQFTSTGPAS